MVVTYKVLLRFTLRHQYFTDEVLRTLAVVPTPGSAERLRRAGWLVKAQPDGFVLLAPDQAEASLSAALAALLPLQFALQPQDTSFQAYTDLPLTPDADQPGTWLTYYFSLPLGKARPDLANLVAKPTNQLPLRPLRFAHALTDGQAAELWPVPAGKKPLCCYAAGTRRAQVDVSATGSGQYELRSAAGAFRFYADDYLAASRAWGLVELPAQPLAAASGTCYTLRFAARAVYWQYLVRGPLPPSPAMLTIAGATAEVAFKPVPPPPGSSACFQSRQPIRLAQCYAMPPLQLAVRQSGLAAQQRLLPLRLPFGQPANLKKIKIKNKSCYISEMFITLYP